MNVKPVAPAVIDAIDQADTPGLMAGGRRGAAQRGTWTRSGGHRGWMPERGQRRACSMS